MESFVFVVTFSKTASVKPLIYGAGKGDHI